MLDQLGEQKLSSGPINHVSIRHGMILQENVTPISRVFYNPSETHSFIRPRIGVLIITPFTTGYQPKTKVPGNKKKEQIISK